MSREQIEEFRQYFAGASVAFGVPFLLLEFFGLLFSSNESFQRYFDGIYFAFHLIGGITGGYLTARRTKELEIRSGIITGFLAFIIQQAVYAIFYGLNSLGDLYSFVGLVGGAIIGAIILSFRKK
ncbi:TIGR04086 family membrane protein [Candidatus Bathyarchaeota archaeon]|nr:TIGR04086 family membrane protein [Candidatus Bathyarchaeota archaeon]